MDHIIEEKETKSELVTSTEALQSPRAFQCFNFSRKDRAGGHRRGQAVTWHSIRDEKRGSR